MSLLITITLRWILFKLHPNSSDQDALWHLSILKMPIIPYLFIQNTGNIFYFNGMDNTTSLPVSQMGVPLPQGFLQKYLSQSIPILDLWDIHAWDTLMIPCFWVIAIALAAKILKTQLKCSLIWVLLFTQISPS